MPPGTEQPPGLGAAAAFCSTFCSTLAAPCSSPVADTEPPGGHALRELSRQLRAAQREAREGAAALEALAQLAAGAGRRDRLAQLCRRQVRSRGGGLRQPPSRRAGSYRRLLCVGSAAAPGGRAAGARS